MHSRIVLVAAACVLACAAAAHAQSRAGPDEADFALGWARGTYGSPITCRFPDGAKRGLRRVVVEPGPRTSERRVVRVQFVDVGAAGAERCTDELGAEERNVVGSILVTYLPRRPHSDTPERDFKEELERGPIRYPIERGRLRVGSAVRPVKELPETDFAGGQLQLEVVEPGSDDARRLADVPGTRQLRLELVRGDTRIEMPLVQMEPR